MSRSIERVWRQMSVHSLMPVMMLVMVNRSPTDPSRKNTAYGGVLPVPAPAAAPATTSSSSRSENLLDQQHRDQRAARGRVLYATGRAPQQNTVVRAEVKAPCERRVVQGKTAPAPNS